MTDKQQSPGRERNAAQPLGQRVRTESNCMTQEVGERERRSAERDGLDASQPATRTTGLVKCARNSPGKRGGGDS